MTISDAQAGTNFGTGNLSLGTVTDATGSMELYYWPTSYSDCFIGLAGMAIPTGPVDIDRHRLGLWRGRHRSLPRFR